VRRIRRVSQGISEAAFARLSVAVALSASLHLYIIYGLALRPTQGSADHVSVINARLLSAPAVMERPMPEAPATQRRHGPPAQPHVVSSSEPIEIPVATQTLQNGDRSLEPDGSTASLPDLVHYAASDLDVYPQPLNRLEPVYPQTALAREIGGSVLLLLLIDESGRVTDVTVVDASPLDVFEESALQAVAATAYSPAQKGGRAVRSRILVKMDYDPSATVAPR
jgi:protein TonB